VQSLHDHDDRALVLVVEARDEGPAIPVDHSFARGFRLGFVGVEGVIDNDQVATPAGEGAADRGRKAASAPARDEFETGFLRPLRAGEEIGVPL
jgi:hypothetical protein